jgi:hypothetical protein
MQIDWRCQRLSAAAPGSPAGGERIGGGADAPRAGGEPQPGSHRFQRRLDGPAPKCKLKPLDSPASAPAWVLGA